VRSNDHDHARLPFIRTLDSGGGGGGSGGGGSGGDVASTVRLPGKIVAV